MPLKKRKDVISASRYDQWQEPKYIYTGYTFVVKDSIQEKKLAAQLDRRRETYYKDNLPALPEHKTILDWIKKCKELIYDKVDGKPVFHAIASTFNVGRAEMQVGRLFDLLVSEDAPEKVNEEIRSTLAMASIAEVPVIPNTEDLANE